MAKPVELVTTLAGEDARRFLEELERPRRNKAWERTVARSRKFDRLVERCILVQPRKAVRRRRTRVQ
jgi:hypothetical protein